MVTASILLAFKKILGGIVSVFLISGIVKSKSKFKIDTIKKHISEEFKKNATKATRLYGNDIDEYIAQNYPETESFTELLLVNAFRPLLVLILISVLDLNNFVLILFAILLVVLIFPIESIFGDKWKKESWYVFLVLSLWLVAFIVLSFSNYYNLEEDNKLSNTNSAQQERQK